MAFVDFPTVVGGIVIVVAIVLFANPRSRAAIVGFFKKKIDEAE